MPKLTKDQIQFLELRERLKESSRQISADERELAMLERFVDSYQDRIVGIGQKVVRADQVEQLKELKTDRERFLKRIAELNTRIKKNKIELSAAEDEFKKKYPHAVQSNEDRLARMMNAR